MKNIPKKVFRSYVCSCLVILLFSIGQAYAENTPQAARGIPRRLLVIPYPFYNDTIGGGIGVAAIAEGYGQKQMLSVGTALVSAEGTYMVFGMIRNFQAPWIKRLILDPQAATGRYKDVQTYSINSPDYPNEDPGSNNSSKDNYIDASGDDSWFEFKCKYLLPIGLGREYIFPQIKLDNGVYVSGETGGEYWNPLTTGRTYIELIPFYRNQSLEHEGEDITQKTAGIDVALFYDNTDFPSNPSRGSTQRIYFSGDWGGFGSSRPWSVLGGEITKYFNLGPSQSARQRVIAFDFWTVDCLTWNNFNTQNGTIVYHRPPTYKGATLGGLFRLRGYPASRFHDRSAIYYALEYRHTLNWNPLEAITLKGHLDVDWIQLVGFAELGRVAPNWNFEELHSSMKWSSGIGVRVRANNIILRADFAASEEDFISQFFIGQPF